MTRRLCVFLVVQDNIVRRSLRELVESDAELELVGQAAGVNQAMAQIPRCTPDVALLDDRLPDGNGFDLCWQLRPQVPMLRCVIFTSFGSPELMVSAVQAGACGWIVRNAKGVEMLAAIKGAAAGEFLLDTGIATAWLGGRVHEEYWGTGLTLTEQEGDLLRLLATGSGGGQIADQMRLDDKAFRECLWMLISKAHAPRDGGWNFW
ncbi:DNA-binding response regulator [Mycobacterium shigaense]|uniref:DNA-binding response regulator n=1 Tax=Mycobacterium shigaense TaxID=722731 RepID=A0A1Z4EJ24_9MYCO|nr:DNA-binding response regulator [Mycobacterium shigaense]